jgi:hypothetical protein
MTITVREGYYGDDKALQDRASMIAVARFVRFVSIIRVIEME